MGLIYFPDQHKALTGMRRALKRGGRVAAIVYGTPDKNALFSTPVGIIRRRANLGPPLPGPARTVQPRRPRRSRGRVREGRLP